MAKVNVFALLGVLGQINQAISEGTATGVWPQAAGSITVGTIKGKKIRLKLRLEVDA